MKKAFCVLVLLTLIICSGCGNSGSSPNPNRTKESCSVHGETNVYPANHAGGNCFSDGDGYYNAAFGHHHHK